MFKKKLIISLMLTFILTLSFCAVTSLASNDVGNDNNIKVLLDGKYLNFKEPPVEIDGRTLVPLRDIFEALGANINWNDDTQTVTGTKGTQKVVLQIDNPTAYINDSPVTLSVPGTLVNEKTMVPTRFIAESMNCVVSWDEGTKTVIIVPDKIITFKDKNLEKAVKTALNSTKDSLTVSDVSKLKKLIADQKKISDLEGLQYLINLEYIDLKTNDISNISNIASLLKLQYIDISENKISDISTLKNLSNLTEIRIGSNNIEDITPLSSLKNLETLSAPSNKISNINVVKDIPNITVLNLNNTLVEDISPLSSLKDLEILNLGLSQITDISVLKNCSDITVLNIYGDALIDISVLKSLSKLNTLYFDDYYNKTEIDDALFNNSAILKSRANSIISKIIKPGMSDLDKELAIHDYIIMHAKYDKDGYINGTVSNDTHMPYGVLVNGVGVCDGYASAMKALLNLVNIDSLTVYGQSFDLSSSPMGHAWNLVKINGNYFYVDTTWDDTGIIDDINTLSHTYFNISTKQISVDHKFDKDFYPSANTDSVDFNRFNNDKHYTVITDNYTFTCNSGYLYKIDNKTQTAVQLSDNKVREISYYDGWIYYINYSDSDKIYKIKDDGTGNILLCDDSAVHLYTINNSIYYVDKKADNNYVHKVDLDGKNNSKISYDDITVTLYISDNSLFYKSYNVNSGSKFVKSDLAGVNKQYLSITSPGGFERSDNKIKFLYNQIEIIKDNWIYYLNSNKNNKICRAKIDGNNESEVSSGSVYDYNYHIIGDWIYYSNASDSNKFYKVKIDGTQNSAVDND